MFGRDGKPAPDAFWSTTWADAAEVRSFFQDEWIGNEVRNVFRAVSLETKAILKTFGVRQ